ncbi:thiamine-phosphate kinase [Simiduia aestuariiviva]|uniref:Thiamine-monophosphate kinase n=1 Tax=Simiduia aestuariiviva TaxID=1510459 RepID=A0A839UNN4_9GAMM|nr:thiamine-phosphate kinase [Simiduia aestuariiviva]MBB3167047.1 thiamine-monophosphate kinase [Simiduia aestuariiviva]
MAVSEFELIKRYFYQSARAFGVNMGIGDDCALLSVPDNKVLAVSMDTLVGGIHFPRNADPELIAERALRVNLSDLAAMGAEPLWFTLGLTMPKVDEQWLEGFSKGLLSVADEYNIALVGGDTTRGPLAITIQVHGAVEQDYAFMRGNARLGDVVFVTGQLGNAAAALSVIRQELNVGKSAFSYFMSHYYRPEPRLKDAKLLRGLTHCAIDISDGLLADLGHICEESGVGAKIDIERVPVSAALNKVAEAEQIADWALGGGDDYQLCFTVPQENLAKVEQLIENGKLRATAVGEIVKGSGVACLLEGEPYEPKRRGYSHFDPT